MKKKITFVFIFRYSGREKNITKDTSPNRLYPLLNDFYRDQPRLTSFLSRLYIFNYDIRLFTNALLSKKFALAYKISNRKFSSSLLDPLSSSSFLYERRTKNNRIIQYSKSINLMDKRLYSNSSHHMSGPRQG